MRRLVAFITMIVGWAGAGFLWAVALRLPPAWLAAGFGVVGVVAATAGMSNVTAYAWARFVGGCLGLAGMLALMGRIVLSFYNNS